MLERKMNGDSMLFYEGGKLVLSVDEQETDNGILMVLKGELRSETAQHIQHELDAFTAMGVSVTMDFKEVTYISSSVLYALLSSQQLIDFFTRGSILLKNVPDAVYQEMEQTGIAELLMIEE